MSGGREIPLELAEAGMVLAAPLCDGHGAVLLPEGAVLAEGTLAALRRRGVPSCVVAGADEAPAPPSPEELERRAERLRHLFRHGGGELQRLLTLYRSQEPPCPPSTK